MLSRSAVPLASATRTPITSPCRFLALTLLNPSIQKGALTGTLPATVTLQDLQATAKHLNWSLQEAR